MRVLNLKLVHDFQDEHACARNTVQCWLAEAKEASWKTSSDIKDRFSTASFLPDNIVIFNLKGNSYRLEIQVAYETQTIFVKWVGTHAEYDKRNKKVKR